MTKEMIDNEEIPVTAAWLEFIDFVRLEVPDGELKITIANGEPRAPSEIKPIIRFDKPIRNLETEVLELRVTDAWKRCISFTRTEVPEGYMRIKTVAGEPTVLLEAKRAIRFDKKGTIPKKLENISI